ncbi:glycosyltransferase [Methylocystis bryophila]|uniref:Glycosyltransferase 2-like domain-containing protein n=1 Tax=Methylocystis bryophila TaxID=655015 RepID=A0A1W6MU30_9HYPH|nr:glycosyltransferase [Methylocystis bryophila]ARN81113.1 hypothetical protein B1812_08510 [Methylocystis bryophila]BDV37040.1 hypothetical protein DSM21852_02930 [Methylocystis bryophila]
MRLSVIVISYNMARELPRTLQSLSPAMQRGICAEDYEVLVIDNGSSAPIDEDACNLILPNLVFCRLESPSPSPVRAINMGLKRARGDLIGVFIDGARMASPGMLANALAAASLSSRPAISTLAFHLGPRVQMESVREGYDRDAENALLHASKWQEDGYRLFDIAALAGSSRWGWFRCPAETNALFLKGEHWREIGGYDEGFETPGGGLANLDVWARICADLSFSVITLLGEATFHQVHGGVATNSLNPPQEAFHAEYERLRGRPFRPPSRALTFFGTPPQQALRWIAHSAQLAQGEVAPDASLPNLWPATQSQE